MVTIEVIDATGTVRTFRVHKHFICHYSRFFAKAFSGDKKWLSYQTPFWKPFGILVDWIYTQKIEDGEGNIPDNENLIDLWKLAENLGSPKLQNSCMEAINELAAFPVAEDEVSDLFQHLYQNTAAGSGLRRYFVDIASTRMQRIRNLDGFSKDMLADLFNASRGSGVREAPVLFCRDRMLTYLASEAAPA